MVRRRISLLCKFLLAFTDSLKVFQVRPAFPDPERAGIPGTNFDPILTQAAFYMSWADHKR
jgi:hypothetical protein